jgi:hypothetical protein
MFLRTVLVYLRLQQKCPSSCDSENSPTANCAANNGSCVSPILKESGQNATQPSRRCRRCIGTRRGGIRLLEDKCLVDGNVVQIHFADRPIPVQDNQGNAASASWERLNVEQRRTKLHEAGRWRKDTYGCGIAVD